MDADRNEIMELVAQRERARLDKNWAEADGIRDQLKNLGVQMNDREDCWQCGTMVGLYDPSYNIKDGAIRFILQIRDEARTAKDYKNSDDIRAMLAEAGIEIKDKEGFWWSTRDDRQGNIRDTINGAPINRDGGDKGGEKGGGSYGPVRGERAGRGERVDPPYGHYVPAQPARGHSSGGGRLGPPADPPPPPSPQKGGGGKGGKYSDARQPPPPQAPHPSNGGKGDYGRRGRSEPPPPGAADVIFTLEDFLCRREEARNASEWADADKIRDVLGLMGIHLKDKERRWYLSDGRSGDYPARF